MWKSLSSCIFFGLILKKCLQCFLDLFCEMIIHFECLKIQLFCKQENNNFNIFRAKAFTSLQQYHLQIITIISPARDSSKQTVNRDILVIACQNFSVNYCMCYPKREQFIPCRRYYGNDLQLILL